MSYWNQKKPKDEEPKSAVSAAMRQQAIENRSYLKDIAQQIPYAKYRDRAKLQVFESALYLVMSDRFEEVDEGARALSCRCLEPELQAIRDSDLYAELKVEVERVAGEVYAGYDSAAPDWAKAAGKDARKRLTREAKYGKKQQAISAASEVLEREMPKISRNQGSATVVFFGEKDAALMEKAMKVINAQHRVLELPAGEDE